MQAVRYDEVNNAEILTFLSVARTLNMSVSAKELCITQPAVSQRISRLEKNHGLILFVKGNSGKLQLTPAGKVFYEEMSRSFQHVEAAFSKAFTVQSGVSDEITLGYDGFFDQSVLFEIRQRFKARNPHVGVHIYGSSNEGFNDLFTGQADLLIRPDASFSSMTAYFSSEPISAYEFCAIMSRNHPLAEKAHLNILDLAGVPLTVAHVDATSPYVTTLNNIFLRHGIVPRFDKVTSTDMLCFHVMLSDGITIASPSFWTKLNEQTAQLFWENLKVFPLGEHYPMSFVWKKEGTSPYVKKFISVYREVIKEERYRKLLWQSYNGDRTL